MSILRSFGDGPLEMGKFYKPNFSFAYNSRIKLLNQLSQAYDSNAKSNAALALLVARKSN